MTVAKHSAANDTHTVPNEKTKKVHQQFYGCCSLSPEILLITYKGTLFIRQNLPGR